VRETWGFGGWIAAEAVGIPFDAGSRDPDGPAADRADQPQNSARCGEAGVAAVLDAESVTPGALRAATRPVLEKPSYRENAQRVRAEIAALPVMKNAVGLLERLAVEKGPVLAT
jgi:UDP:flavonoid glycosyltransferase YjiC (YdhE family)